MMPQLQMNETKTHAVEEKAVEATQADKPQPKVFNELSSEVEEICTDEAPTSKTVSNAKPQRTVSDTTEEPSPLLIDPYEFDQCTITIVYTRTRDAQVSISVHSHKDEPIVKTYPQAEVPLPEQIEDVMNKLFEIWPDSEISATMVLLPVEGEADRKLVISVRKGSDTPIIFAGPSSQYPLPTPITSMLNELKELLPVRAMKKMEKEAKEKSKTNSKAAAAKTAAPSSPKIIPAKVDGKTQMTFF